MNDAGIDAQCAQALDGPVQALHLLRRLAAGGRIRQNFRRGKVREYAIQLQMLAFCKLASEALNILRRNSQSVHACIHFQMNGHVLFAEFRSGGFKRSELFATMNRGGQIVMKEIIFFAGPKSTQHQNRFVDPGLAKLHTLASRSHSKPIATKFFQRLSYLRTAVPVAVTFDDAQHLTWCLSFFRWGINVVTDSAKIVRERG